MASLGTYKQQPAEIIDYAVDFGPWVEDRGHLVSSFSVLSDAGVTVSSSRDGNVVRVIVSGGTNNTKYKITVRVTTDGGLVKEAEFWLRIKEV
jgi:hypothetical protein